MKHLPTFVSVAVLLLAAGAALRLPQRAVPVSAIGYVFAQAVFVLLAWFVLQRDPAMRQGYLFFYSLSFGVVLLLALTTTWKILSSHPTQLTIFVAFGGVAYFASIGFLAYWYVLKAYDAEGVEMTLLCLIAMAAQVLARFFSAETDRLDQLYWDACLLRQKVS